MSVALDSNRISHFPSQAAGGGRSTRLYGLPAGAAGTGGTAPRRAAPVARRTAGPTTLGTPSSARHQAAIPAASLSSITAGTRAGCHGDSTTRGNRYRPDGPTPRAPRIPWLAARTSHPQAGPHARYTVIRRTSSRQKRPTSLCGGRCIIMRTGRAARPVYYEVEGPPIRRRPLTCGARTRR